MDEQRWNPILDGAMEILARKNTNAVFVEEGTGLWIPNQVADLVPWQLLSIQLAYTFRRPSGRARNSGTPCTAAR